MTSGPATPSVERQLRQLFWTLVFRGRAAQHAASHGRKKRFGIVGSAVLFAFLGILPGTAARTLDCFAFASTLHAFTLLFASLTLAADAGTVLFVREEADILLHRPVRPEQLLRAKFAVLMRLALLSALALNLFGLFSGMWTEGGSVWFLPAHLASTALLMVFSASMIVLVYNLCLRWFGRERLDDLLTLTQTLLVVAMVLGGQLVPSLVREDTMGGVDVAAGWWLALPPVWFGALDALLLGARPAATLWLPAGLALAATGVAAWLAFVRLGSAYGTGLQMLNEAGDRVDRPSRRLLPWLVARPPLRWWLRDPVQRHAFVLATAYMARDRETKLKLYPGVVPFLALPVVWLFVLGGDDKGTERQFLSAMSMGYMTLVPLTGMTLLQRSPHWRAAEWFRIVPMPDWSQLFHGARKAVLCWLTLPVSALFAALLVVSEGSWQPLLVVLPTLALLPVASLLPGLVEVWLPLSLPQDEHRMYHAGCLVLVVALAVSAALAGVGMWLASIGWLWGYVGGALGLVAIAYWWVAESVRARSGPLPAED